MIETFYELELEAKKDGLLNCILNREIKENGSDFKTRVEKIVNSMIETIQSGLNSSELSLSGLSGDNTLKLVNNGVSGLISPLCEKAVKYSLATIEENARMGKIAACPTAGSSGIVPGVLISAYEEFNKTRNILVDSMIIAGEIGRIISIKMPLAGAVAGCQAECGAASAMASGALCFMLGCDTDVIFNSAALCLKNVLGLTCDPVAGLVEVPCVKRNAFLTIHSITSAYLAISGIKSLIPLDDIIDAMKETGMLMTPKLKESSEAGLAKTKTGIKIKGSLENLWSNL